MRPIITIEMCRQILEACSEGADYKQLAKVIGVSATTISHWHKRGSYQEDDKRFKSNPIYQLFAVAIESGQLIYNLKRYKKRLEINLNHNNQGYRDEVERSIELICDDRVMDRMEQLDFYHNAIKPSLDHMSMTGQIQEKVDSQILAMHSYFESLIVQIIKFEPTWKNAKRGRPKTNVG